MLPTLAFAGLLLAPYWIAVSMPRRLPLFVFVAAAGVALVGLYGSAIAIVSLDFHTLNVRIGRDATVG